MLSIVLVDVSEKYPEYDYQIWNYLSYPGVAIPLGRRVGEWSWIGRIYK
jgi:hypothetical protein